MTKVVLALTLSAAMLAAVPVHALEQDKGRCVLKADPTEKIVACPELPMKDASAVEKVHPEG